MNKMEIIVNDIDTAKNVINCTDTTIWAELF